MLLLSCSFVKHVTDVLLIIDDFSSNFCQSY